MDQDNSTPTCKGEPYLNIAPKGIPDGEDVEMWEDGEELPIIMWTVELWPWHLLRADMEEENQPSGFGYGKFGEFIEYSNKRDA